MRRWFLFTVAVLTTAVFSFAQEVHDVETTVSLLKNGNAVVEQKWDVTVTSGTEWYIPITNLGNREIRDFSVYENDRKYESDGRRWNSDRSRSEKAFRSGIVEKSDGVELCWGQGEYGHHVYAILYVIEHLVESMEDADGFIWQFVNDELPSPPQHMSLTVENETEGEKWVYEDEPAEDGNGIVVTENTNVGFWGFGFVGKTWLAEDGSVHMESTEPFVSRSSVILMMRFNKGLFHPLTKDPKYDTFDEMQEKAFQDSSYSSFGSKKKKSFEDIVVEIIGYGIAFILLLFVPLLFIGYLLWMLWMKITGRRYKKSIFGVNKIDGWWREVPLGGDPTAVFSLIATGDHLCTSENFFPNLVGAYFLKWLQEGRIRTERDPRHDSRVNLAFVVKDDNTWPDFSNSLEERIYGAAREAAGKNLLLEKNEFKAWSRSHDSAVTGWPGKAKELGQKIWNGVSQEDRQNVIRFKNFLSDYTMLKERAAGEVGLWKQYMILAQTFGIAEQVMKNFEKLFPDVFREYTRQMQMMDTSSAYYILNNINVSSRSMMNAAISKQAERRAAANRSSGGGGGFSSFGGGGGFSGGGHGGGSR